jgi:thiol-disulfide isomerase/thioredoxin
MKKTILIFLPIALLFAAVGVYFGAKKHAPSAPEQSAAIQFLAQSLPDAQGIQQPLSQWAGKKLVLNFWATWCAPCVEEMPELTALQGELTGKSVQIIGVGIDSPSNIAEFSKKYKIGYPLYVAGLTGTELARRFGNQAGGLPFTVLIDSNGIVKKTYTGRLDMAMLRKDLVNLL